MGDGVTYVHVEDTVWPSVHHDQTANGCEWVLRYGTIDARERQRLSVASVVAAYATLTNPWCSQAEAIRALKRARAAALNKEGTDDG